MLKKHVIVFQNEWTADNINVYERINQEIGYIKLNHIDVVDIDLKNIKELNYKNIAILLSFLYEIAIVLSRKVYISATEYIWKELMYIGLGELNYIQNEDIDYDKDIRDDKVVLLPISNFKGSDESRIELLEKLRDSNREYVSYVKFIINNLSENCTEHTSSQSSTVDCFAYVENRNKRIQLFVMDLGNGFYESFERNHTMRNLKNNVQAIKEVVQNQYTSKIGEENGYGIIGILGILSKRNGRMFVRSKEAFVEYEVDRIQEGTEIQELKGSCILIEYDME